MNNYKYILFDADNTLFDFNKAEHDALTAVMKDNGVILTEKQHLVYHDINDALWKLLEKGTITRNEIKIRRFAEFIEYLGLNNGITPEKLADGYILKLAVQTPLIDGAMEICSYLSNRYELSLITNGITYVQRTRLSLSPITKYFTHIFISDEMGVSKPQKEYMDKVMDGIGSHDTSDYLIIGDSLSSDIRCAENSGVDSVWIRESGKSSSVPTYTVNSLADLRTLL